MTSPLSTATPTNSSEIWSQWKTKFPSFAEETPRKLFQSREKDQRHNRPSWPHERIKFPLEAVDIGFKKRTSSVWPEFFCLSAKFSSEGPSLRMHFPLFKSKNFNRPGRLWASPVDSFHWCRCFRLPATTNCPFGRKFRKKFVNLCLFRISKDP